MATETYTAKVDGMICPQCEDEIAHKLLYVRGIISCEAAYRRNLVTVEYDSGLVSADDIERALSDMGYPVGTGHSGGLSDTISLFAVIGLYFLIPFITGLLKVPVAESGAVFSALFVIGVLTGVHCIGMCGGIMLVQGNALMYNLGRILSYTGVGAVFGALGKIIGYDDQTKSMLFTICGLLIVLAGLKMWGVPFLRKISPGLTKPCRFKGRAFAVGILTGIMPCGALSSMWIFAASTGSWKNGAAGMLSFGLGTCVFMLFFGMFGVFIPKKYNKYILKGSTVLIVALGLIMMTKGLKLLG